MNESVRIKYDDPTLEQMDAGIAEFKRFGDALPIYKLSKGDITKFNQIQMMPYIDVFGFLYIQCVEDNYNKRYSEILKGKTT